MRGYKRDGCDRGTTEGEPSRTSCRTGLSYVTDFGVAPYIAYAISFTPVIGVEAATGQYYRPLLQSLEQARRSALARHDHRPTFVGI
ncbi:hypothetical protein [Niveispirillum irakense]|uniref:hypothetical protein n=1 Tax=Niveispirillum irakense TaxID=34011 RepID=UPI000411873A|nr:hypothetical protein [Niveispirillum irakense]